MVIRSNRVSFNSIDRHMHFCFAFYLSNFVMLRAKIKNACATSVLRTCARNNERLSDNIDTRKPYLGP